MSIGNSGRLVIEVEPQLKKELHAALREEGVTLKAWFLSQAEAYLVGKAQMALEFEDLKQLGNGSDEI